MAVVALATLTLGAVGPARFTPRQTPPIGATFTETSVWRTTGHNRVLVGALSVRDKAVDSLSSFTVHGRVDGRDGEEVIALRYLFAEQVERDGEELEEIGLDGVAVLLLGLPGQRSFAREDQTRLKRTQKKWLEEQFMGSPDAVDPLSLLLPDADVVPGSTWDLSMDGIQKFLGSDRFTLDRSASHARVTLDEVSLLHGTPTGRFRFDVLVIPKDIKDVTATEARMTVVGTADLPLDGSLPWRSFEAQSDLRFVGIAKRAGVTAHVDLALRFVASVARGPSREP